MKNQRWGETIGEISGVNSRRAKRVWTRGESEGHFGT